MTKESTLSQQLEQFFIENQDRFYRIAYNYVNDHEMALDVIQDAIIKAVTKLDTLQHDEYLKTWFYRILINESISAIRKERRYRLFQSNYNKELVLTSDQLAILGDSLDLYQAIHSLEPKLKTIILLRFYEELKLDEIAQITNTNVSTVKTRLYKALDILKKTLGREIDYG